MAFAILPVMAARAMGTGTISFGLVAIPIKLYSTGESAAGISFNWLHGKCGNRVKQQYFCPTDEEVVERKDLVKGYEFAKDRYVVMNDDELATLTTKATNSVDITEFVPVETVDPIYYERSYFLGPDKGGDRPYRLLAEAMRQTGRVALARYAARGKNYLVLLRPFGEGLVMQQLRYADEVRSFDEVPVGEGDVKPAELALAKQLIDQIAADGFKPETYKDDSREEMREILRRKVEGVEETAAPVAEPPRGQIIDLMQALKASLAKDDGESGERRGPRRSARSAEADEKPARSAAPAKRASSRGRR
jgi:DNA end-binding protein Ku